MQQYTYAIIGGSAAGVGALNRLWQLDPKGSVICISDQVEPFYNKCFLTNVARGEKTIEQISLPILHENACIIRGKKVLSIDKSKKELILSDNTKFLYQQLLIATGSSAYLPSIEGVHASNIISFHSLSDVKKIIECIQRQYIRHVVVLGAGVTGLECADMFYDLGTTVSIVEQAKHILPSMPWAMQDILEQHIYSRNIQLFLGQTIQKMVHSTHGYTIDLSQGHRIQADMVVRTIGARPNSELAYNAGLRLCGQHIWVNEYMQTSDISIYAAGDVVIVKDQWSGAIIQTSTWPDAGYQGVIAAHGMVGDRKQYHGALTSLQSYVFGVTIAALGVLDCKKIYPYQEKHGVKEYIKIVFDNGAPIHFHYIGNNTAQLVPIKRALFTKK